MPESSGPGSELFDSQQHLLVEYCRDLTDNEDDAASLAASVLSSARSLLNDPSRLRAWLFALARREALLANQGASEGPGDPDREVLDLVHRHGIQPSDLSVVLGISGDEAAARLAAAQKHLDRLANGETDPGLRAVGVRRRIAQLLDLRPIALSGRRLQLAVATAVAVAAIASGAYVLSDVAKSGSRNHVAQPGGHPSLASAPTATQSLAVTPSRGATPVPSVTVLAGNQVGVLPGVSPTAKPSPRPTPTPRPTVPPTTPPTSPPPSPSAQPSTSPSPSASPSPSPS